MLWQLAQHRHAFTLAALMLPDAVWTAADGDIGTHDDADIGLEDKGTGATLVLHADGTATLGIHRLCSITVNFWTADARDTQPIYAVSP